MTQDPPVPTPAAGGLGSRTFIGLLVAQFFAAFNDQAIHAAAMFFAINKQLLSEKVAISIMPILFYSPWAIFCTLAGYTADKYSKRTTLVVWKIVEVAVTLVAVLGFFLGNDGLPGHDSLGPIIVLGCVFLMGTHSAFFVPAKYGVMPEILPPHLLSKGNGLLESLSFLAVILGTVCGGVLSEVYRGNEVMIGWVLLSLAVVGALASFIIKKMPAANPARTLPWNIYAPIVASLRTLFSTKALRVALLGIAFFTFVVAFMRAAVYMLGEGQVPRWDELKTSVVVGTVALGIGLGSPLAGFISGRRVNLRLVLVGAIGMILALVGAAVFIQRTEILVGCTIAIGFCTGFYIVPLFTLLQVKAPKTGKGEMIATSNFINVVGAITASVLFLAVVTLAQKTGLTPEMTQRESLGTGPLIELTSHRGRVVYFAVDTPTGRITSGGKPTEADLQALTAGDVFENIFGDNKHEDIIEVANGLALGAPVSVTRFALRGLQHYELVEAGKPPTPDYDNQPLPAYLFFGAAGMTLLIAVLLARPLLQVQREQIYQPALGIEP